MTAELVDSGRAWAVLTDRHAHVATDLRVLQRTGVDTGVLECAPGNSHGDSLLRVHRDRFAWTDPEEARVEMRCAVEESSGIGDGTPAVEPVQSEQLLDRPVAVSGKRTDQLTPGNECLPEGSGVLDSSRRFHGHPGDDDRIVRVR